MKKFIIISVLSSLVIFSCSKEEQAASISRPFAAISGNGIENSFESTEGYTLLNEGGTIVEIEPNILMTKDGEAYNGMVNLQFEEFHSPGEIIASGITMKYDSLGQQFNFTSAGMFYIDFKTQDGEELMIKKGKSVNVQLASNVDGNYNFYKLDKPQQMQQAGFLLLNNFLMSDNVPEAQWNLLSKAPKAEANPEYNNLKAKIDAYGDEPQEPVALLDDAYKFEIEANIKNYPELEGFKGIIWQYAGKNGDGDDPEKNEWINDVEWTDIKLIKDKGSFYIELFSKDKNFKTVVTPVFSDVDLKDANKNFEKLMKKYDKIRDKKADKYKDLMRMRQFKRTLKILAGGIYNCDIVPTIVNENVPFAATYKTDGNERQPETVYVVQKFKDQNRYLTMSYSKDDYDKINLNKMMDNMVFGVYDNKSVAICEKGAMPKEMEKKEDFVFNLSSHSATIANTEDLDMLISDYMYSK